MVLMKALINIPRVAFVNNTNHMLPWLYPVESRMKWLQGKAWATRVLTQRRHLLFFLSQMARAMVQFGQKGYSQLPISASAEPEVLRAD